MNVATMSSTRGAASPATAWRRIAASGACTAALSLLLLACGAASADTVPLRAGTVIRNIATATYVPAGLGRTEIVSSNEVSATVQPVEALSLTQDRSVSRPPGSTVTLSHQLQNIGNIESSYTITLANNAPGCTADSLDLGSLQVVRDVNGNGVADAGEAQVALGTPNALRLAPGESAALLLRGSVPNASTGVACVGISAATGLQGATAINRDTVTVGGMAVLAMTKSARYPGYVTPGQTRIDFTINATNIGAEDARPADTAAPTGTPVLVNGAQTSLVLLRDPVPAGTEYIAGSLQTSAPNATRLFRLPGDAPFSYRTAEDASAIEVAVGLRAPVARNASVTMQFSVQVRSVENGAIRNTAYGGYHDGRQTEQAASNTVVIAGGASIGVAKLASAPKLIDDAAGGSGSIASVRFRINVRNYGHTTLYDVQASDQMEGSASTRFGTFTTAASPAANQYTIVPGSLAVVASTGAHAEAVNPSFNGTASGQDLLAAGVALAPGGELTLEFEARINVSGRTTLLNSARALAAQVPGGPPTVGDASVDGANPDPDRDGDPGNNTSPTPVLLGMPNLQITKASTPVLRLGGPYAFLFYRLLVVNNGTAPARGVRVIDNLSCAFDTVIPTGAIESWQVLSGPRSLGEVLVPSSEFTGRADCDLDKNASSDPFQYPADNALSLTDGTRDLAPGQADLIEFGVLFTLAPEARGQSVDLINKSWAVAFDPATKTATHADFGFDSTPVTLLVDPQGVVYDAVTRKPVAGAVVTMSVESCAREAPRPLTKGDIFNGFSDIYTFNADGSVSQTTDANGLYEFYLLAPPVTDLCTYKFSVKPPAGYKFSSQLIPPTGGVFDSCSVVVPNTGAPSGADPTTYYLRVAAGMKPDRSACEVAHNHIPLDPDEPPSLELVLRKDGSKRQAELGDFIDYALTVTNKSTRTVTGITFSDSLPPGFGYVARSTRLNGDPAADPAGGAGPGLIFQYPSLALAPDQTAMVRYRVRIGVGAPTDGDAINRARASSGDTESNLATWKVRVLGGVFSDEAFAFGKVYMDCRRDGRQLGTDEIGVPGVRLYMEDGTHVITDIEGKWSLYGLKPVTHVLRVDETTLPRGARLEVLDNRNAKSPNSRFLDLKTGEFHKANFIIGNCDQAVAGEVAARRAAIQALPDTEAEAQVRLQLDPQGRVVPVGDVRSLPASGQALAGGSISSLQPNAAPLIALPSAPANASTFVNGAGGTIGGTLGAVQGSPALQARAPATASAIGGLLAQGTRGTQGSGPLAPPSEAAPETIELEKLLPTLPDARLDFISPQHGDTLPGRTINVRVKGADGSFRLSVNGTVIDDSRVGKKTRLPSRQIAAWEYIGIVLQPGTNVLKLEALDGFGNVRGTAKEITVVAPDNLAAIELGLPGSARADLRTQVPVRVRLLDGAGVPVTARTQLTLEADRGRWLTEDLNPQEPGTQVFMEGGTAEFALLPPGEPGDARIRVSTGSFVQEGRLPLLPDLRPMIGVGIVEGVLDLTDRGTLPLGAMPAGAAFERELASLGDSSDSRRASGRAAFFFKGAIKGEYLLTAAFDSDKREKDRLFRDIRPDEFYPIYGDSAARGFDAQSTQKLYVRIDKNRSYLLYGDFTTASSAEVRQLSQSNRSLTGLKHVYESDRVRATSYASRTAQTQQVEEFRALGTSGPYYLSASLGEFVENSEQIEILVRDRNQPDIVLQRTPMTRFVDYVIEPLTRRILFTRPIASIDGNLNPQSIRVTYEVDGGGPKFTVAGTDVQVKVNEALQLGVVASTDRNPANQRDLQAVTGLARLGANTTLAAEAVQTQSDEKGSGSGARAEARYQGEKLDAVAMAARTSEGFDNPGSTFSAGRTEASARAEYRVDPSLSVRGETLYGRSTGQGQTDKRKGSTVSLQKKFSDTLVGEVGVRYGQSNGAIGSNAGFDYGQVSTYDGRMGSSIGANSVTALGAAASANGVNDDSLTTVRGRLTTQVPGVPSAQVFVEAEQDINDSDRRVLALGGNYAITDKTRIYGRYELISSLYGPYALDGGQRNNIGIVGIESNYMQGGRLYNEYRISDGAEGRGVQSAIGVRNTVAINDRIRLTGGIEHTRDLSGYSNTVNTGTGLAGGLGQSTAVTGGIEYMTDRIKSSAVLEGRNGDDANTRLFSAGFAYKLDPSWSLLARSIVSRSAGQGPSAGNERNLQRHQVGVAYRPVEVDTWNALARYERRKEEIAGAGNAPGALLGGGAFGAGSGNGGLPGTSSADIVSAHVNYNPAPGTYVMGRYAGKLSRFGDAYSADRYWAHLLHGRFTYDINKDWDAGVQAGVLHGKGGGLQKTFGLELGYQIYRDAWVSVGYNFVGLHDRDLTANEYTSKGFYLRLRFKFDETTLGFEPAGGSQ